ncbi:MAG: hypothetical protein V7731_23345 [Amphritea sp.]
MSEFKKAMDTKKDSLLKSLLNFLRQLWRRLKDRLLPTVNN